MNACQFCEKPHRYIVLILYSLAPATPPFQFRTEVYVCDDHSDVKTAAKVLTPETIETIKEGLQKDGYKNFDKSKLSVAMAERSDAPARTEN